MRSTRATTAVARLNKRSNSSCYTMVRTVEERFYLAEQAKTGELIRQSEAMDLDEFVVFVNAYGPQKPKRISKLDAAFAQQLEKKK